MTPAARLSAGIDILDLILANGAAEKVLTRWARQNRYAGSSDRVTIRDLVFDCLRRKRSLAVLGGGETGRGLVLGHVKQTGQSVDDLFTGHAYAPAELDAAEQQLPMELGDQTTAVRLDYPDWLEDQLLTSLGTELAAVMGALRSRAKVFLRVNPRKSTVAQAIDALGAFGIVASAVPLTSFALDVTENARKIVGSQVYLDGIVELQDAASQAVTECFDLPQNGRVLDYCAGGGGKVLAMAAVSDAKFFAYDFAPARMQDLPARAARADTKITILAEHDIPKHGPYDLVFCDVPCSGSGAWRRSPASKWDLTPQRLVELQKFQADILLRTANLVAPGGLLVYATCSILKCENEDQVSSFIAKTPTFEEQNTAVFSPVLGADGMFVSILKKIQPTLYST
jgi:16S rRNA (cytosine967-C5)-methyltransferase